MNDYCSYNDISGYGGDYYNYYNNATGPYKRVFTEPVGTSANPFKFGNYSVL